MNVPLPRALRRPRRRPSRRRDERGVAATVLLSTGMILGVAILLVWAAPLTVATDAKSRNQAAADAAAIAAAESVRVPTWLTDLADIAFNGNFSDLLEAVNGQAAAERLAYQNDPRTTQVTVSQSGLEAYVVVRSTLESGEVVESSARARLDLPSCTPQEVEVPPEEEDPPEGEDPPGGENGENGGEEQDPPEPEVVNVWTCGGKVLNGPDFTGGLNAILRDLLEGSTAKLVD